MDKCYQKYIRTVDEAISTLIEKLEDHYPGLGSKVYATPEENNTFYDRMCFGIYIELMRAGYIG